MPTARFAASAFRIARAYSCLPMMRLPERPRRRSTSASSQRIIERPHHYVHGRGQQRVGVGAQLPVAQMRSGEQHASALPQGRFHVFQPSQRIHSFDGIAADGGEFRECHQHARDGAEHAVDNLFLPRGAQFRQRHREIPVGHAPQPRQGDDRAAASRRAPGEFASAGGAHSSVFRTTHAAVYSARFERPIASACPLYAIMIKFYMVQEDLSEGLTFDDVLLEPAFSDVLPSEADTRACLTREIALNVPIVSAAMDTVTESHLAIALAQQGGIGIVHRNMPIARQAEEVDKVKRSESGMIVDPITIAPDLPISAAQELMARYRISGVPVTKDGRLVGILTNRDLRFENRFDAPISEVMTKENLVTVPVGTTLEQAEAILHKHRVEKLLVVDDQFILKGLITVKDIQKKLKYPNSAKDSQGRLRVGAAIGATGDFLERATELVARKVDVIAIDTAHGHSSRVLAAVSAIKSKLPEVQLITGNVATYEGAKKLISLGRGWHQGGDWSGVDLHHAGGSGAGVPQITAISECARACREGGVPLIADGGIKFSGDITKAIAAGADAVMIGSLLAGTDESPGETILYQGRTFKTYRGMGSLGAQGLSSSDRYAQDPNSKMVPEGIEGRVAAKGPLSDLVYQLVGGLRSGMGYCGARNIRELQQNFAPASCACHVAMRHHFVPRRPAPREPRPARRDRWRIQRRKRRITAGGMLENPITTLGPAPNPFAGLPSRR
jgi:IMP dehydrogenase